ncbi:MAG: hypothetical protein AAB691_03890, partial [Patescibacteria group bacterium]
MNFESMPGASEVPSEDQESIELAEKTENFTLNLKEVAKLKVLKKYAEEMGGDSFDINTHALIKDFDSYMARRIPEIGLEKAGVEMRNMVDEAFQRIPENKRAELFEAIKSESNEIDQPEIETKEEREPTEADQEEKKDDGVKTRLEARDSPLTVRDAVEIMKDAQSLRSFWEVMKRFATDQGIGFEVARRGVNNSKWPTIFDEFDRV